MVALPEEIGQQVILTTTSSEKHKIVELIIRRVRSAYLCLI